PGFFEMCAGFLQADVYAVYRLLASFAVQRRKFFEKPPYRKAVERQLKTAQHLGKLRQVKYCLAILAVMDGQSFAQVALILRVHEKTIAAWVGAFCCYGLPGAPHKKPTGRPPKLTPTQK